MVRGVVGSEGEAQQGKGHRGRNEALPYLRWSRGGGWSDDGRGGVPAAPSRHDFFCYVFASLVWIPDSDLQDWKNCNNNKGTIPTSVPASAVLLESSMDSTCSHHTQQEMLWDELVLSRNTEMWLVSMAWNAWHVIPSSTPNLIINHISSA